jgi:outer membrane protein OmpA-like peptidoglycan-associated protein
MLRSKLGFRSLAVALVAVLALATGCASGGGFTPMHCAAIGAVAGGAGGATYGTGNDKGHDIDSGIGYGVAIGAATGTVAYFICKALGVGEKPAPAPPAPAPAPAPAPPPPAEEPAPPPQAQRIVLRGVQFDLDKADIRADAGVILDEAANQLNQVPGARVSVEGHTDSSGADSYNQSLSERRAGSVKDYLVGKGVDGGRLTTAGFGESQPVADNATAEGRALNRRVELKVQE